MVDELLVGIVLQLRYSTVRVYAKLYCNLGTVNTVLSRFMILYCSLGRVKV